MTAIVGHEEREQDGLTVFSRRWSCFRIGIKP
jgi:hypothetical protein